jgi:GTP-binding protein
MAIYGNPHTAHDDIDSFESNDSDDMNRIHHGKKGHNSKESDRPSDYEEIVNQGIKSEDDGMYYFDNERGNEAFLGMGYGINDDELVSSSSESFSDREKVVVADLDKPGSYVVAAYGGRGGVGNCVYAKRQFNQDIVAKAGEKSRSKPGEEVHLELELKLIADIGLVGFPNAGKSSLLAAMSKARPEIAPYPFTTLHPLIGCVEYRDGFRAIVADVPGLVDGAALGRGRGHDFLKHLERTKALLYIVDAAGVDGRDPLEDFSILVDEIQSYGDGDMMARPALVVANKLDLIKDEMMREEIYLALDDMAKEKGIISHEGVLGISAGVTGEGLPHLSKSIRELVELGEQFRSDQNELYVVES